jgi:hypothetical protein
MLTDQDLIDGLRRELAGLQPPVDLVELLREQAAAPRSISRLRFRVPIGFLTAVAGITVAIAITAGALLFARHRTTDQTTIPFAATGIASHGDLVLSADGLGTIRFRASLGRLERFLFPMLGRPDGGYQATLDECGVDHALTWPIVLSPSTGRFERGEELTVLFHRGRFVGYQYGGNALPAEAGLLVRARTVAGLAIGDPLSTGQRLYGRAFRISTAQGGIWQARTPHGKLTGYAYGNPKVSDVSPSSRVASIDAGDVGCPAMSP